MWEPISSESDFSTWRGLTLPTQEAKTSSLSLAEHKSHVLQLIKKWCHDNKENLNLENFQLEEDTDFTLDIEFDQNSNVQANIECKCGRMISLPRNGSKIQMSNYYKHLYSLGCSHMKGIKKDGQKLQVQQQQLQSTISTSCAPISQPCMSPAEACTNKTTDTQLAPSESSTSRSQPN
ncbi:unnamed protein product [Adineta steineri]|uniref:Uncharacterized protein n=1 Tax=Adineta steineri TaxID=433720 RepID=A0A814QMK6_9BILA|nr:unnamed protein product [Adineta steineri]